MAFTDKERQETYRERMYNAGFKQMRIWVPRKSENIPVKTARKAFMGKLEELTAGWPRVRLAGLLDELLVVVKRHVKKGGRRK